MVKFIIVDDNENDLKLIKSIIRKTAFNGENIIEIKCFKKYDLELQQIIDDTSERKIFLLDIDLNSKITGMNIALKIRENDWDSEIIFLTAYNHYFVKVYKSIHKIFSFIEKNKDMEKNLTNDIKSILKKKYDNKMYKYSNNQINLQIYLKDILYIYRDTTERKLVIVTTNNRFLINKNICDILEDLDNRFVQTNRSCIANKKHVNLYKWTKGSFILDNSEEVFLLSKKYKDEILKDEEEREKVSE